MANILIVDDSTISRINLKKILVAEGHKIVGEGSNGIDAVEKYSQLKPDILTLDITMPEMNGIEALKIITSNDPSANVIMISALNQNNKILEALEIGAKNYIAKPYEPNQVLNAIKEIL
ncbi:MAG: response regulator [Vulcanibacillus sp.]